MDYDKIYDKKEVGKLLFAFQKFANLLNEIGVLNPHEGSLYY